MGLSRAVPVVIMVFSLVAHNAQGEGERSDENKKQSLFVKSVSSHTSGTTGVPDKAESAALEKLLSDAEALLNSARPAEAYALLEPVDFEYAGNSRFDYLLGVTALDSGHPDKATLAFERVLAVDPNFAGARLDMARAYFHLGDLARAKTEFDAVLKQDPPEAARITIVKYLNAITAAEQAKKIHYSGYVEGGIGHDSNVNNSTNQSEIPVPALGNLVFTLSPTNQQTADNYYSAGAGGEVSKSLDDNWSVYGGADLRKRGNRNMTEFDASSLDTRAGVVKSKGDDIYRMGGTFGDYTLGEAPFRDAYGISGDWRHNLNQTNQINVFGQYTLNQFAQSDMQINNFDQTIIGAGLQHILADGKTALFGSVNLVSERATDGRADGDDTGYGLRVGGQTTIREAIDLYANAGYQTGNYDQGNAAFLTTRSDRLTDLTLGGNWHFAKFWTMRPQVSYTKNNSNITIYAFNRLDTSINVRREF